MPKKKKRMLFEEPKIKQINIRMTEGAIEKITEAARREGKEVTDFIRVSALNAAIYSSLNIQQPVCVDEREGLSPSRAVELGFEPISHESSVVREVRVFLTKNGLHHDRVGNLWGLCSRGLLRAVSIDEDETKRRLAQLTNMKTGVDPAYVDDTEH